MGLTMAERLKIGVGGSRTNPDLDPRTGVPQQLKGKVAAPGQVKDGSILVKAQHTANGPSITAPAVLAAREARAQDEEKTKQEDRNRQRGRSSTILNGGAGLLGAASTSRRSLIGI